MKKWLILVPLAWSLGLGAQEGEEGLLVDRPTTITDVSPYQGKDVGFVPGEWIDMETWNYNNAMGAIDLDASSQVTWNIGCFWLPVDYFKYDIIYNHETFEETGRVNHIGSFINRRTPVSAREVKVSYRDAGYEEWVFFSVPFNVRAEDINGGLGKWVIRKYSGEQRAAAQSGKTWVNVGPGEMLRAGEGYIFMRNYQGLEDDPDINWEEYEDSDEDYSLTMTAAEDQYKQNIFSSSDIVVQLKHYEAERSTNADWNFVANPYPCYYDVSEIPEKATLYVWDYYEGKYQKLQTGEKNDVVLAPLQPFFVQADGIDKLTFRASGRRLDGCIEFLRDEGGDDDPWGDDEWGDDDEYVKARKTACKDRDEAIAEFKVKGRPEALRGQKNKAKGRREALRGQKNKVNGRRAGQEFNPESPYDPGANYYNPATGEAVFDLIPARGILIAALQLFDGTSMARTVKTVTVLAPPMGQGIMSELFSFSIFTECERIDLGQSWGFTTIPANAFFGLMKMHEIVLPSCVEAIDDEAFQYCMALEQMDIWAKTPPRVTQNVFTNMHNNLSELIIRVPEDAVEAYKQADVWKTLNIQPLKTGSEELQGVTLSVLTPEGEDITDRCNIVWRNEDGNVIAVGSELTAQSVGTAVTYSIGLPASLLGSYEDVPQGHHTVAVGQNNITVRLVSNGVANLGTISLLGSVVTLAYDFVPSSPTSQGFNSNDVQLTVTDKATGAEITDGVCRDTTLIFQQTRLKAGQAVTVRATSRSGSFVPVEADAVADADGNLAVALTIIEYGHARLVCTRAEGVGSIMATVYDAAGLYAARFTDNGAVITVSGLPDGRYTAVVMQQSQYFNVTASLADLQQTTLREGVDYAKADIQVSAGHVSEYKVNVPALDESGLTHIADGSYFTTQNASVTLMQTATLKARVTFKPEYESKVDNIQLVVVIPEGMKYQEGSLISLGGSGQLSGRNIVIPCRPGEQVRLAVGPEASGEYTVNAYVQYILEGRQYKQPIGNAVITVEGISLNLLDLVNRPDVHPHGYAFGNSRITFYDGDKIIGETTARANGAFDAEVTLTPACDDSHHAVYAIIESQGKKVTSEVSYITYDKDAPMVEAVSMVYQGYRVIWDMQKGTVSPNNYSVNPDLSPSTTFQARLSKPQPDKMMNTAFIVGASDGLGYEIPAQWDEATHTYVATADFGEWNNRLPTGAEFTFDYIDPSPKDRSPLLVSECRSIISYFNAVSVAFDRQMQAGEILEDTEDRLSLTFTLAHRPGMTFLATVQTENPDDILAMREEHEFIRYGSEEEGYTTYVEDDGQSLKLYVVDLKTREATSIVIGIYSDPADSPQALRGQHRVSFMGVMNGIGDFAKMLNPIQAGMDLMDDVDLSDEYRREMRQRLSMMQDWCGSNIRMLKMAIAAVCPNGEPRVPGNLIGRFSNEISNLESDADIMVYREMPAVRELFERAVNVAIAQHGASQAIDLLGGKIIKAGGKILRGGKLLQKVGKISEKIGGVEQLADALESAASDGLGKIAQELMNKNLPKDFKGIKQYYDTWTEEWFNGWKQRVRALHASIVASYDCKDLEPHVTKHPKVEKVTPILDPSGYVYEGVVNNRVKGVTATIFYKADEDGAEEMWNAAEFGQENPQQTDINGIYMWNVPKGLWQVRFQKEGYETAQTAWLPVPPPQLDIAVPMVEHAAPQVTRAEATAEAVSLHFSKYMKTASLNGITVKQGGSALNGTIEGVDDENGLASHFRFLPAQPITATQVELIVPVEAMSYSGEMMAEAFDEDVPVRHTIESLIVQEGAAIELGKLGYVQVVAYPAQAVAGRTLRVSSRSPLLELGEVDVAFDEEGQASVPFKGLLPGKADVTFAIADMEAKATVEVKYHLYDIVAIPIPNIADGTVVGEGSSVELFTATDDAVIYYTTDGSCPCDPEHRILYTGPIPITGEITIQAIAVREGMQDSEVVTLHYVVGDGQAVDEVDSSEIVLSQDVFDLSGQRVRRPLNKGVYILVKRTPQGIKTQKILIGK